MKQYITQPRMSGATYVAGELPNEIHGMSRIPLVKDSAMCDHTKSICVQCYTIWQYDYTLYLGRTGAGRWLQAHV
jgi:hypothetical protein